MCPNNLKPLHYKLLVTKKKIHIIFWSLFTASSAIWIAGFYCYPIDRLVCMNDCVVGDIIHQYALITIITSFFAMCSVMVVSYIIITVKSKQRNSMFAYSANDVNTKIVG